MNYRFLLSCLLLGFVSFKSLAQDSNKVTLPQLWDQAIANYPSVEAYRARVRQAQFEYKLVKNQNLPDIHLQGQNTLGSSQSVGGAFFPLPGIFNIGGSGIGEVQDPAINTFGSVTLDWEFMQFGRQKKSLEAANIQSNQAQYRLEMEKVAIQAEISRSYFQVLLHQQMNEWAERNHQRLESLFGASKSMAQAGIIPGADSLLVKASLEETAAQLDNWKGLQEESEILLALWTNLPMEEMKIEKALFFTFLSKGFPMVSVEKGPKTPHPSLDYQRGHIHYAEKQKELAFANVLPSISLLGGMQVRGQSQAQGEQLNEALIKSYQYPVSNYLVGVGLKWNMNEVFDLKLNRGKQQEVLLRSEADFDELSLNLQSQEQIALKKLALGEEQINHSEQAFLAASEAYDLYEIRYANGLISITELLQIQEILQRTERTRIGAYHQYWTNQVELAEARADFLPLQDALEN